VLLLLDDDDFDDDVPDEADCELSSCISMVMLSVLLLLIDFNLHVGFSCYCVLKRGCGILHASIADGGTCQNSVPARQDSTKTKRFPETKNLAV
jgi:hypothetical protein